MNIEVVSARIRPNQEADDCLVVIAGVVSAIITPTVIAVVPVIVRIRTGPRPLITLPVFIIGTTSKLGYRDTPVAVVIRRLQQPVRSSATELSQQFIEGQNTIGIAIDRSEAGGLGGCGTREKPEVCENDADRNKLRAAQYAAAQVQQLFD